ncbi:uncharacterized protein B0P05DRAFT_571719 [Gilbertella persicaria]|uniref:uncharacterized protein n=1 Tax=Gilbertella persicaria TaxID=101096 RepID=UPI002220D846|nr:uncharacterized protein B0P05DRAFT_571719 [Gilbertella persicaria]KAI8079052.1 hypothetical protein B0P05DRAFT_571719 [Gilbertella persicaria]
MPNFSSCKSSVPSVKTANKTSPPPNIQLEGYLMKQKHGKSKSWLKRYFVLYGQELRYYKSRSDTNNALAVISLNHYSLIPDTQPHESHKPSKHDTFCLVSDDETKYDWPDYYLQAANPEERSVWEDALQHYVTQLTSVLDKWLDRLDIPHDDFDDTLYSARKLDSVSIHSSQSNILLSTPSQSLRNHKSTESLSTTFTSFSSYNRRRPSDFTCSKSSDLSSKILGSKAFSWTRPKSSASSVVSSITDSEENDSNEYLPQHTASMIPNKALEMPIIHPSEYNKIYTKEML